ncbi:MAG: hypothetical protein KDF60_02105 [Calditrichaeota bacterium]|nr:hypothetical protein [Calditrichota bacterium]
MLNKIFGILLIIGFVAPLIAQQTESYNIFQLRFLYNEVKFTEVIAKGHILLKNPEKLSQENLVEIHKYLALSFYNLNQQDSSRSQFYSILTLQPKYEPDPVHTSPKILSFFNDIKSAFRQDIEKKTAVPFRQYVFVEDIRGQAAARSFLFPGWGQLYKSQDTKAYILGGAFLATSLTTIITYQLEKDLKTKYRKETNPLEVSDKYNDYNTMSKTRRFFMYSAFTIWGLSLADAMIFDFQPKPLVNNEFAGIFFSYSF